MPIGKCRQVNGIFRESSEIVSAKIDHLPESRTITSILGLLPLVNALGLRSAVTSSSQRGELLPLRSPKGDALKALF